jgi:hypothetical protein
MLIPLFCTDRDDTTWLTNPPAMTHTTHSPITELPLVLCGIKLYLLKSTVLFYAANVVLILLKYVSGNFVFAAAVGKFLKPKLAFYTVNKFRCV